MFAEVRKMQNGNITLLQTPVTVDIRDWVIHNIGKVAAAKRHQNTTNATIYAIEESDFATPQMIKYAEENNAMILVSISKGEIGAID